MECEDGKHLWESLIVRSIALPPPDSEIPEGQPRPDQAHEVVSERKKCIHCGKEESLYPQKEIIIEEEDDDLPEPELEEEELTNDEEEYIKSNNQESSVEFGSY
tara:strand:- start:2791 stop:3102 length:312 start_codon:yes stop_codon:yes gene_type:complete